jgi:hypothetical protein
VDYLALCCACLCLCKLPVLLEKLPVDFAADVEDWMC